jgi:hypothetical protein
METTLSRCFVIVTEAGVEVVRVEKDAVAGAPGDEGGDRLDVCGTAVQVVGQDDLTASDVVGGNARGG